MSDLISRQAAIDAANDWLLDCMHVKKQDRSCGLIRRLEDLPPVQLERKKGKWITYTKGSVVTAYKCSECGRTVRDDTGYDVEKDYPFCHCGADMRGEQNE